MNIGDQITAIIEALEPWRVKYNSSIKIAHHVPHLFKILGDNPGVVRAAILFAGETTRDAHNADVVGRVDRKFWIAFSRGYSLESYPGKSLVDGIAAGAPMFETIQSAVYPLRQMQIGASGEPWPYYMGTELLTFEGVTLDAYRIEIEIASDLGNLEYTEEPETA